MVRGALLVVMVCACGGDDGAGDSVDAAAGVVDAAPGDDAAPVDPLDGIGTVELVATLPRPNGGANPFTEGPVWRPTEGVLLFSDIPNSTIHQLTPPSDIVEFRMPSGEANGLANDAGGLLLAAEHAGRRVSRTLGDGSVVAVADNFEGQAFHSPNDMAVAADGTIYFTDPPFGGNPAELNFNGLFRVDAGGTLFDEVRYESSARPNGVGLSPDGSRLYMADTTGVMLAYDVGADGSLSNEDVFDDQRVAGGDGMAIDTAGNIWVTTSDGIDVFAPSGQHWGTVSVPKQPANCAFGDADKTTLYITARDTLYRVSVVVPGL